MNFQNIVVDIVESENKPGDWYFSISDDESFHITIFNPYITSYENWMVFLENDERHRCIVLDDVKLSSVKERFIIENRNVNSYMEITLPKKEFFDKLKQAIQTAKERNYKFFT